MVKHVGNDWLTVHSVGIVCAVKRPAQYLLSQVGLTAVYVQVLVGEDDLVAWLLRVPNVQHVPRPHLGRLAGLVLDEPDPGLDDIVGLIGAVCAGLAVDHVSRDKPDLCFPFVSLGQVVKPDERFTKAHRKVLVLCQQRP